MSDEDLQKLEREKELAEIKAEAVKAAQDALVDKLTDKKPKYSWEADGKKAPDNYDELFEEIGKKTVNRDEIGDIVSETLTKADKEKADAKLKADEDTRKMREETIKSAHEEFDREWYDLVKQGKMPAVGQDLQDKINKSEAVTQEDIDSDEGLTARRDLASLVQKTKKPAKVAYYEEYKTPEQPGKNAPVFGRNPRAPKDDGKEKEHTYDEIVANRKKMFGY